ncbi:uncharacterized protein DDB_G0271670 [Pyrus x bretschneideri]|uniref:uncharacterized protein DDB_G0271670 n=1 Tax=Pyrus x bretschneideri TaxID=225117 RepID=UPI00202DC418|nr:uncharacterized protein DDB_G0271670 [Pyrus x bretschneideri]
MGAGSKEQMLRGPCSITKYDNYTKREDSWVIMEGDHDDMYDTTSSTSISNRSSTSSSDLVDDASSSSMSSSCSSCLHSHGSLFDLSDLMDQLPIKRGLSKYFEGKCQSFTSLSKAKSIEDLAKKESPYKQRKAIKASKSYGGGLSSYRSYTLPKATISKSKKPSTTTSFSSRSGGSSFGINNNMLPRIPVRK